MNAFDQHLTPFERFYNRRFETKPALPQPVQLGLILAWYKPSIPASPDSAEPQLAEPGDGEGGLL